MSCASFSLVTFRPVSHFVIDAGDIAAAHAAAKAQAADVEADRLTELVQLLRSRLSAAEQRCDELGSCSLGATPVHVVLTPDLLLCLYSWTDAGRATEER